MLKRAAVVFGIAFIAAGILGFVPGITTSDGYLLGIFHVNAAHNVIHLVSGAAALYAGMQSESLSRLYFQVFGVIYALVALLGLFYGREPLLGFIAHNPADVVLHLVIAAAALYFGFGYREHRPITA
ncbi:membrane protein [Sulfurifustis variabilis]|uniref:Membrane protein n=1 Tax=Sulfurifustis variabilis TaxID=1675686 RepID=A0A1B4V6A2_9GAMM|nr:DUF4383 domain-containing protein [Sulfurifustis variabilis]BAU49069.1 membrane protein [Sulfurifustis variabilis]